MRILVPPFVGLGIFSSEMGRVGVPKSLQMVNAWCPQGLVNVPIKHHPTIGNTIPNRYLKVMFKIPQKGHLPTPGVLHFLPETSLPPFSILGQAAILNLGLQGIDLRLLGREGRGDGVRHKALFQVLLLQLVLQQFLGRENGIPWFQVGSQNKAAPNGSYFWTRYAAKASQKKGMQPVSNPGV